MQEELGVKWFTKRAKYSKKCAFAKFRVYARDTLQEHDRDMCDVLMKNLRTVRCEDPKSNKRVRKAKTVRPLTPTREPSRKISTIGKQSRQSSQPAKK